jgi:hypothetical protein
MNQGMWGKGRTTAVLLLVFVALAIVCLKYVVPDYKFSTVSKTIELILMGLGLFSIVLLAEQIRLTERRGRRVAYHEYFDALPKQGVYDAFNQVLAKYKLEETFTASQPVPSDTAGRIYADANDSRAIRGYLDDFEEFAGAVNVGVVDEDYAFSLESSRTIRAFRVLEPLIVKYRAEMMLPTCYLQLQRVCKRWEKTKEKQLRELQKLNERH